MAGAEQLFRQALDMWRSLMSADHYEVANALNKLATVQYDRGATREAIATEREALAVAECGVSHSLVNRRREKRRGCCAHRARPLRGGRKGADRKP
jgi:hypothetical protein